MVELTPQVAANCALSVAQAKSSIAGLLSATSSDPTAQEWPERRRLETALAALTDLFNFYAKAAATKNT